MTRTRHGLLVGSWSADVAARDERKHEIICGVLERRYEVDCWSYVPDHRPKWVGRSDLSDPKKFPPRSARRSVGRSRPTRFFFAALRAAVQGAVPTLIFLAALCAAVGRSDRSDPKISSPRSARRSVGRTRPTRNRPLAREVGRSVGDAKPTINFVPPSVSRPQYRVCIPRYHTGLTTTAHASSLFVTRRLQACTLQTRDSCSV